MGCSLRRRQVRRSSEAPRSAKRSSGNSARRAPPGCPHGSPGNARRGFLLGIAWQGRPRSARPEVPQDARLAKRNAASIGDSCCRYRTTVCAAFRSNLVAVAGLDGGRPSGVSRPREEETNMGIKSRLGSGIAVVALLVLSSTCLVTRPDAQSAAPPVEVDADDIGGVVLGKNGPEPGVWVIAQTTELGTRFAKSVVTDDRGRYVIPDLPPVTYEVWVRGYGLVDSPKVKSGRGQIVNLTAVPAPTAKEAAEYYPAIYWLSMLKIPDRSLFPGTGLSGNGMPETYKTQEQWLNAVQLNGCGNCHQLGDKATREIPAALGTFDKSIDA